MAQAEPIIGRVGLAFVGKIGLVAVSDVEEVAEDGDGGALLAFAQKSGDGQVEELAEEVEESGLDGGDGVDGGAQVEGLEAASFGVAVGEAGFDLVEDLLAGCDVLAFDKRAALFEHLANLLAAGDFADASVAGVVGEDDEVAGEEGGMGSAEIEQHRVVACDRNDAHGGDGGGLARRDVGR